MTQGRGTRRHLSGVPRIVRANSKRKGAADDRRDAGRARGEAPTSKLLFEGADWDFALLHASTRRCGEIALDDLGLDVFPNQIEVISAEQMLDAYSSVGMPLMYRTGRSASVSSATRCCIARAIRRSPTRSSSIPTPASAITWRKTPWRCRRWCWRTRRSATTISSRTIICSSNGPIRRNSRLSRIRQAICLRVRGTPRRRGGRIGARRGACADEPGRVSLRSTPEAETGRRKAPPGATGEPSRILSLWRTVPISALAREPTLSEQEVIERKQRLRLPEENLLYPPWLTPLISRRASAHRARIPQTHFPTFDRPRPTPADQSAPHPILAFHPPPIRQKVVPHISDVARVRRTPRSIAMGRHKRRPDHVLHTPSKPASWGREIARILSPQSSQGRLQRVSCRHTGQAHPVSFAETLPVRAVFFRTVNRCPEARADRPRRQQTGGPAVETANHCARSLPLAG